MFSNSKKKFWGTKQRGKESTLTKSYLEEALREENRIVGKRESFSVSSPLLLGLTELATATPLSFFISLISKLKEENFTQFLTSKMENGKWKGNSVSLFFLLEFLETRKRQQQKEVSLVYLFIYLFTMVKIQKLG